MTQHDQLVKASGWTIFFSLLLTLSLVITLLCLTLQKTVFDQKFVDKVLVSQNVYEKVPALVQQRLELAISSQGAAGQLLQLLSPQQTQEFFSYLLPADYLQQQTNQVMDRFYDFLNLKSSALELTLDLTPIKQKMAPDGVAQLIRQLESLNPTCTTDQMQNLLVVLIDPSQVDLSFLSTCTPPEPILSAVNPVLQTALQSAATLLPDSFTIFNLDDMNSVQNEQIHQFYANYQLIRKLVDFLPWLSVVLAVILFLLNTKSFAVFLRSLGVSGLIASGFDILLLGAGYLFLRPLLPRLIPETVSSLMGDSGSALLMAVTQQFFVTGIIVMGIALVISVCFLILRKVVR
jgi:hypothetical protein